MKSRFIIFFSFLILILFVSTFCHDPTYHRTNNQEPHKTNNFTKDPIRDGKVNKTIVRMNKRGGVNYIPIMINGIEMEFIFDTGASIISISDAEALFLYKQNKLKAEDFITTHSFIDATGTVSEGTIINIKTVQIGDKVLNNVRASVVHNLKAPLLLGMSALEQFGKISIDNVNGIIEFE